MNLAMALWESRLRSSAIPSTVPAFILKCESKPQLKDLDDQLITNCEQKSEKV